MQRDNVTVTLAVGAAPWQKTLAASLLKAGMLRRLLTSNPYLEIQDPNGNGSLHEIKRFPLNRIVNGCYGARGGVCPKVGVRGHR